MMKRKVVAMMMAVTLAAGMLSGCGSTVKTEDGASSKVRKAQQRAKENG